MQWIVNGRAHNFNDGCMRRGIAEDLKGTRTVMEAKYKVKDVQNIWLHRRRCHDTELAETTNMTETKVIPTFDDEDASQGSPSAEKSKWT